MKIYKAETIILRSRVYGEADRILTLFTREFGKVAAIAKGVRKPTSRLRGAVQLFSHAQVVLYAGKSLDTVTQGEALETFHYLQDDLVKLATASYCSELVDSLTMERQPLENVFNLLLIVYRQLPDKEPELVARIFEAKLLAMLGYRPRLDCCVHKGCPVAPLKPENDWQGEAWFSVEKGGRVCSSCAALCSRSIALTPVTLRVLNYFLQVPFARAAKAKLPPKILAELDYLLRSYLTYHCEVRSKARGFLDAVQKKQRFLSLIEKQGGRKLQGKHQEE